MSFYEMLLAQALNDSGGGGGGSTGAMEVATGTFTGGGANNITFSLGKKCPYTDFVLYWYADNETEYAYDSNYKYATGVITVLKQFNQYNLSTDGSHGPSYNMAMKVNNNGTITNVSLTSNFIAASTVRNGSYGNTAAMQIQDIIKSSGGFSLKLGIGNSSYKFVSGLVYNWKLLYIGNDPDNDIVEVA